jgi:hypothetical protein
VKLESGVNKATTHRIRAGLARGFGLTLEAMSSYLDGECTLQQALASRVHELDVNLGPEDRYPSRPPALQWALASGYPSDVIKEVASIRLKSDEDPGGDYWIDLLRVSRGQHKAQELGSTDVALGASTIDDEIEATKPKLKKRKR